MKIYLASKSPRRQELLKTIVNDFEVLESNFDEDKIKNKSPKTLVKLLSEGKCKTVFENLLKEEEICVIGADTVVCINNKILGKPKDKIDAKKMLKLLSGKTHKVLTGVCIMFTNNGSENKINFVSSSNVKFKELTEEEIENYISTDEPYDKAGAYAMQGNAGKFVEKISGSYHSIIGFPVAQVYSIMKEENII